jgi:hypothetical protein
MSNSIFSERLERRRQAFEQYARDAAAAPDQLVTQKTLADIVTTVVGYLDEVDRDVDLTIDAVVDVLTRARKKSLRLMKREILKEVRDEIRKAVNADKVVVDLQEIRNGRRF